MKALCVLTSRAGRVVPRDERRQGVSPPVIVNDGVAGRRCRAVALRREAALKRLTRAQKLALVKSASGS